MVTSKKPLKKTIFSKFSEKGSQKNEKYLGDVWLQYEDIYDRMNDDIRYIMFGGLMSKNYIHYCLNDYEAFGKLMGHIILDFKTKQAIHEMQQSPEYQKAVQEQLANQTNTQTDTQHYGVQ